MIKTMKKAIFGLLLIGCATSVKQNAYVIGRSSKLGIDTIYGEWDRQANNRVTECVEKLPPAEHTKSEYDECVGPFTSANQKIAISLLQEVQAAQLVLYLVLSENRTEAEVIEARDALISSVLKLRVYIEEHR
jgi:hypothetical protein